jgi:hypothetical protein
MENEIYYIKSQGQKRDLEILERYSTMIDYFRENPDRIFDNEKTLCLLYYNDVVLCESGLRDDLLALLNLEIVKKRRKENVK